MRNIKQGKGLAITGRWEEEQLQIGRGALTEVTFLRLEKTREWAKLPSAGGIFQAEGRASARPRGKPRVWCIWGPACLLMARAVFPPWGLFGLRHPSTGGYRWSGRAGSLGCGEEGWPPGGLRQMPPSRHEAEPAQPLPESLRHSQAGLALSLMSSLLFPLGLHVHRTS